MHNQAVWFQSACTHPPTTMTLPGNGDIQRPRDSSRLTLKGQTGSSQPCHFFTDTLPHISVCRGACPSGSSLSAPTAEPQVCTNLLCSDGTKVSHFLSFHVPSTVLGQDLCDLDQLPGEMRSVPHFSDVDSILK